MQRAGSTRESNKWGAHADPQSSISSAAVMKAKANQPCLTLKELEGVRGRLKELLDESNAHLQTAMAEPRLRMRMQMLTSELSKANALNNSNNAAATAQAAQAVAAAATTAPPSNPPTGTPLQHPAMLSPEVVNNLIKRPLKQEDLKPPPLPKARKQQQQVAQQAQAAKIAPSPKTVDEKAPRTPATSSATPAAESSTPGPSNTTAKRAAKRKGSTATPKASKKSKVEEKLEASPSVATPAALAATPQESSAPAAPSSVSAATPAPSGFTGNALNVSRSTHADYFAQQQKAAEAERAQHAQFFASRHAASAFDGDIAAALSMWEAQQSEAATAPGGAMPPSNLGEAAAVLAASAQTEDALADQSWHDFINEQNFDPDEPTPLLTRCRSLDTDPECSPRDADMLGRSPLVQMHGVSGSGGYATAHDKFGNVRRVPLMSPSAQPYNGMLFVDQDDTTGLEGFM